MALGPGGLADPEGDGPALLGEINITPLVDVMLVLLIVFMVAAPLLTVGVPVELPRTQAGKPDQPRPPLLLTIDRDGHVFLRQEPLAPAALAGRLAALAAEDRERVVYVRGDREVAYGRVMEVMGQAASAGFAKVSLLGQPAAAAERR
jgi:biopolymer transport protein ExbD